MGGYLRAIYTDTHLTALGLLIFFSFFLTVCFWVYFRKNASAHYQMMGQLPLLNDGEHHD